jgi:hypothetical protein
MTESKAKDKDNQEQIIQSVINVEWTPEHETILVEWADKAMCYRWMHSRSNVKYSKLNAWYTIPVIVISTLTGTANFAQDRVPYEYQSYFVMLVGGFNILAGIITTIQQFLKITQLNEAHRVANIAWDKFYRNIKVELAKHPDERLNVSQMLKTCKEEFDRLMETSPIIPDDIINMFDYAFKEKDMNYLTLSNNNNSEYKVKPQIIKPEICNSLVSTELSRNPWFTDENKNKRMHMIANKEKINNEIVTNFKQRFFSMHNREPLDDEILDNLKDKIEETILKKLIEQQFKSSGSLNQIKSLEIV